MIINKQKGETKMNKVTNKGTHRGTMESTTLKINGLEIAKWDREYDTMDVDPMFAIDRKSVRTFYKFIRTVTGRPNLEITKKDIEYCLNNSYNLYGFEMRRRFLNKYEGINC